VAPSPAPEPAPAAPPKHIQADAAQAKPSDSPGQAHAGAETSGEKADQFFKEAIDKVPPYQEPDQKKKPSV
jgi:hypothetical protein